MRVMIPRRWLAAVALLVAATAPAKAAWAPFSGPVSPLIELHLDPGQPDLLYARVFDAGSSDTFLWRSKDGGATWSDIQKGLGRATRGIAIDPSDPRVIWVWT